jgi:hypothetical protein
MGYNIEQARITPKAQGFGVIFIWVKAREKDKE